MQADLMKVLVLSVKKVVTYNLNLLRLIQIE